MLKHSLILLFFVFQLTVFSQKPEVVLTTGHTDFISSLSISPDAKLLVSGGLDKLVKINDIATGRELRTIAGNSGRIT